ncbi:MAG: hypothetical protein HON77_08020 [Gammaproteobacteria bacterium]|nr:hypothetical protein [Gammaproteobacteria bacterium]
MRLKEEKITSRTYVVGQQESIDAFLDAYVVGKDLLKCLYEDYVRCEKLSKNAIEISSLCLEKDLECRVGALAQHYPELLIVAAFIHPSKTRIGGVAYYRGARSASRDWLPMLVPIVDDLSLGGYLAVESLLEEEATLHQIQICLDCLKSERPELELHIHSFSPFLEGK